MSAIAPTDAIREPEIHRLRTLCRLLDSLNRARAPEDVYDAALSGLLEATSADGAAILLHDDDGVIRFKAAHGLSLSCQTAVTGHSPWKRGEMDARPFASPDVFGDPAFAAHREVFAAEGVRALAFVPLALEAGVFGQFMLCYREPHEATWNNRVRDELEVAGTIAAHVALATDRKRAELARNVAVERLMAVMDHSPTVMFAKDLAGRYVLVNGRLSELFGPADRLVGQTDFDVFPRDVAEEFRNHDRVVLETGRPLTFEESVVQDDGLHTYVSVKFPLTEPDGRLSGVCGIATDISDRKRLEAQLLLLLEASGSLLSLSLPGDVLPSIVKLAQRFIDADAYSVWLRGQEDTREHTWTLSCSAGLSDLYLQTATVIEQPGEQIPDVPTTIEDIATGEFLGQRRPELVREGVRSVMIVPLRRSGETDGTIVFYWRTPRQRHESELRLGAIIGNLASSALRATDLYERQLRLREESDAAARRAAFLSQAGNVLASSLDYHETLTSLTRLAVPSFADWAAVDIVAEDAGVNRVALTHTDPAKMKMAADYERRYPPGEDHPVRVALRTGKSVLAEVTDERIAGRARDAERAQAASELGIRSFIVAPMLFGDRRLGTVTFATAESGRVYTAADLETAEELARRAAISIEHARLHSEALNNEERFHAIVDTTPELVKVIAPDGTVLYMNSSGIAMLGAGAPENIIGAYVFDVIAPEFRDSYRSFHESICAGERGSFEFEVVDFAGERRAMESHAAPLRQKDGSLAHLATTRDVTRRRRAEGALRESEAKFHQLADAMPAIVWTARPDGFVDYYNERWYRFLNAEPGPFGDESWAARLHPEDVEKTRDVWYTSVRTGVPYVHELRIWDAAEKRWRWFLAQALPARDGAGKIVKWFGTTMDIDSQKHVEDELRRANEALEQFAWSASHDLQEPLRTIKIFGELLAGHAGAGLDAKSAEYLRYVRTGVSRMEMLIRDLLAYTQIPRTEAPVEPVDASAALDEALANLSEAISESGARITRDPLPRVPVHSTHLRQLFQNLAGNAIKYSAPERPPEIHIGAKQVHGLWIFSVRDNGIGIEREYHRQIFGLFKRLHTRDERSGTGIGLAICQRIVERYRGHIWVKSEPGSGATFFFSIPF